MSNISNQGHVFIILFLFFFFFYKYFYPMTWICMKCLPVLAFVFKCELLCVSHRSSSSVCESPNVSQATICPLKSHHWYYDSGRRKHLFLLRSFCCCCCSFLLIRWFCTVKCTHIDLNITNHVHIHVWVDELKEKRQEFLKYWNQVFKLLHKYIYIFLIMIQNW